MNSQQQQSVSLIKLTTYVYCTVNVIKESYLHWELQHIRPTSFGRCASVASSISCVHTALPTNYISLFVTSNGLIVCNSVTLIFFHQQMKNIVNSFNLNFESKKVH